MMVSSSRAKCPIKKYPIVQCHIPEERRPQTDYCESLKTVRVMCIQSSVFVVGTYHLITEYKKLII
jgi:hypothetical protein